MFSGVLVPRCLVSEPKPVTVKCSVEPRSSLAEEYRIVYLMFLAEFSKKYLRECLRSRGKEPDMEILLRLRIGSSVQPVALIWITVSSTST